MRLTTGERAWLQRRMHDLSMTDVARSLRLPVYRVHDWELGKRFPHIAYCTLSRVPQRKDLLALYRRRAGLTMQEVATQMGVTRATVFRYEHGKGDISKAMRWWAAREEK